MKEALYEAASSEDGELAEFFREIRGENRCRAEKAGRLLAGRPAE